MDPLILNRGMGL